MNNTRGIASLNLAQKISCTRAFLRPLAAFLMFFGCRRSATSKCGIKVVINDDDARQYNKKCELDQKNVKKVRKILVVSKKYLPLHSQSGIVR